MLEDCLEERFEFTGCKIALICDGQILTILRDDKEDISWPNMWELPGGDYVIIMTGANYLDLSRG